jgi:hypothetical protein
VACRAYARYTPGRQAGTLVRLLVDWRFRAVEPVLADRPMPEKWPRILDVAPLPLLVSGKEAAVRAPLSAGSMFIRSGQCIADEFDDSALMQAFGQVGTVFLLPFGDSRRSTA